MADKIRILIVDDLPETRENVRKLLQFESDVEVIAQAGNGEQAIEMAKKHIPDVILMDINMPGIDGIGACQRITQAVPVSQIIIMSVQSESDYLRRAMLAGARDFLTKPMSGEELITAIRRVYNSRPKVVPVSAQQFTGSPLSGVSAAAPQPRQGKVIAVYSPKGGIGCTTIATNLAVALAQSGKETLIIDGSLQFGDVAVMLNMKPTTSLIDLIERVNDLDPDLVSSVVLSHKSGVKALLAPPRPEMAEHVTTEHIDPLISRVRQMYEYIIIDTASALTPITLGWLDTADKVCLVASQTLPSLTNASRYFDLAGQLGYETGKVLLVINEANPKRGISIKDVADTLKRQVFVAIPSDAPTVEAAIDQGVPIVVGALQRRPSGLALTEMAEKIIDLFKVVAPKEDAKEDKTKRSGLSRLFGR
ncbi:MAG: response regulator [Chloroflexi bacterium]|nr:response regulator [Chloroflexota bacterium]